METKSPPPQSILVYVGLDLVGDGLMKLPFLRALRRAYPDASITWLAGKGKTVYGAKLAGLVTGLLDEVVDEADIGNHWRELFSTPLKGRHFDLIIDTQRRVLTTLILRRITHKVFVSGAANYFFSDVKPLVKRSKKPAAMIRQMLDLVEAAAQAPADPGGVLDLGADVRAAARAQLPDRPGADYIALAPGAGGEHKRWPLENFITLAKLMAEKGHIPVFFLGPDEADWRADLSARVPQALFPLQTDQTYGVHAPAFTIALGERCGAGLAADCGGGHMLSAADIPLISLFGPTPAEKFAPCTTRLTILKAQDFGGEAMAAIPVEAVEQALEAALSKA